MAADWGAAAGAASDLLGSKVTKESGALKAKGIGIQAQGTRLSAASLRIKAQGDIAEASNYDLAAGLARQNKDFASMSDEVKEYQLSRQINQTMGSTAADVAAAGFGEHGSALDLLRDSASQGALSQSVLHMQGLITEAGYEEQAKSYDTMAAAGRMAAAGEQDIANKTDIIAGQQDQLAAQTMKVASHAADVQKVTGVLKAISFVAGIFGSGGGGGGGGGSSGGGGGGEGGGEGGGGGGGGGG